ncbi:MAG: histone deacetylase family protein [Chloroflexota bacterium]
MTTVQVVYSPVHRGHDPATETVLGRSIPANEVPERAERIRTALEADGGFELVPPKEHGEGPIRAVHDPGLVRFLAEAWPEARRQGLADCPLIADTYPNRAMFEGLSVTALGRVREPVAVGGRAGWWGLDSANPIVAGTYEAARAAVDVALTTADLVLAGAPVAYGLCRPPGHHAARSMAGGYCFFNNAAIAAEALVGETGQPVAILDVDFHHGNGTQQIFWRRGDVNYVSIHGDPVRQYPYFLGHAEETGEGEGEGANHNLPLPAGVDDAAYLDAIDRALEAIEARPGSFIVVSLGFDTYELDPLGDFALTTAVYHEVGRRVAGLGRPLVILQEGGYHRPTLGVNVVAWLRGVAGRSLDDPGRSMRDGSAG